MQDMKQSFAQLTAFLHTASIVLQSWLNTISVAAPRMLLHERCQDDTDVLHTVLSQPIFYLQ